jgi:hypothetical protein
MGFQPIKFYQTGTFTVGNRLLPPEQRSVQSGMERANALNSGHRACQGCGEALGARYAIDAAMNASGNRLIAVNATGCLEVFSTPYPETSWQIPWIHSLFGNAPAVATGVAAANRVRARKAGLPDSEVRVIAQGGDGSTTDIGLGCLSGMFERNDDVLYICYDNQAYMNTGVQRSSATPPAARTATTMPVGPEPGNTFGQGKNVPMIAMAHGIPYVACVVHATSTSSCRARWVGVRLPTTPSRSPVWPRKQACSRFSKLNMAKWLTSRRSVSVSRWRITCACNAVLPTCSAKRHAWMSSNVSNRWPNRTSAISVCLLTRRSPSASAAANTGNKAVTEL